MSAQEAIAALADRFPDVDFRLEPLLAKSGVAADQLCVRVPPGRLCEVLFFLRDDPRTRFEQLCDLTCVDYLGFPGAKDRFAVVYSLLSLTREHRLWVKCFVNDPAPEVPSATGVWKGAEWPEREVYDMFGIRFAGHPDCRRLLTWEGFPANPLRKDYPLRGRGERQDYEVFSRDVS